jgi:hypothetical protein
MTRRQISRWIRTLFVWAAALAASPAVAQQATIGAPFNNSGDSFFETNGVNFGFNIPAPAGGRNAVVGLTPQGAIDPNGINFVQGGGAAAAPQFGGGNQGGGATFGFAARSPLGTASFGFSASQGSTRSLVSQTPSVTLQNGATAFISDTSQRPFVTSVVPVVGGFAGLAQPLYTLPAAPEPVDSFGTSALGERLHRLGETPGPRVAPVAPQNFSGPQFRNSTGDATAGSNSPPAEVGAGTAEFSRDLAGARQSSAGQPAASIAEIRAQQAADDEAAQSELRQILDRAQEAIALGKPNVARIYYQQLARRATGPLRQQALDGLKATDPKPQPAP